MSVVQAGLHLGGRCYTFGVPHDTAPYLGGIQPRGGGGGARVDGMQEVSHSSPVVDAASFSVGEEGSDRRLLHFQVSWSFERDLAAVPLAADLPAER